jgi:hypothetical protein
MKQLTLRMYRVSDNGEDLGIWWSISPSFAIGDAQRALGRRFRYPEARLSLLDRDGIGR